MTQHKFEFKLIPVNGITTGGFQARDENMGGNLEDLVQGIKAKGLMQPVGVARSEITEGSDKYEWEILWGQRRVSAYKRLKNETKDSQYNQIPAMVIDKVLTNEEGMQYSLQENVVYQVMTRKDIYNTIKKIYVVFDGDEKKCAEVSGIPLPLVRDALRAEIIDRLANGREIYNYGTRELGLPSKQVITVLELVRKPRDITTADKRKGKNFCDVLATCDVQMRNKIIKAANNTPTGDIDGWVAEAKMMKTYKKRTIEILENEDKALVALAESLGSTPEDITKEMVLERLATEGFV